MKSVYIELTEEQKEKLSPLFEKVYEGSSANKPVLLMAQIYLAGPDAVAVCRIIDYEKSLKLQEFFNPKGVGKIATPESIYKRLKMSRAENDHPAQAMEGE